MLVLLSAIENIVLLFPSFVLFLLTRSKLYSQFKRAVERRKNFIMPGHYLALINRAGGLYGRLLTAFGLYKRPRSRFFHTDRLSSVNRMFIISQNKNNLIRLM